MKERVCIHVLVCVNVEGVSCSHSSDSAWWEERWKYWCEALGERAGKEHDECVLVDEEENDKRWGGGRWNWRQTLTSPFVLLSGNAHSWFRPAWNTALCYCHAAALPSSSVRCRKQCNSIQGWLCFTASTSLYMRCNTVPIVWPLVVLPQGNFYIFVLWLEPDFMEHDIVFGPFLLSMVSAFPWKIIINKIFSSP